MLFIKRYFLKKIHKPQKKVTHNFPQKLPVFRIYPKHCKYWLCSIPLKEFLHSNPVFTQGYLNSPKK